VNLFDPDESNVAPSSSEALIALGTALPPTTDEQGRARDEWWVPVAILILALLMLEWLVYERDGARRLLRSMQGPLSGIRARRRAAR